MQLQFQKKEISCLRQLGDQMLHQEQTVEVRLDDTMPQIGRVLGAWGQVMLRGKEWRSSNVQVTGGVMAWVLYLPEDGGPCCSVETWLPFQWKVDIPPAQRDGTVIAGALLRSVDGRSLSSKKLLVRANVGLQLQTVVPDQVTLYQAEELPEDVQLKREVMPLRIPTEAGEKPFVIDEVLQFPAGSVPVEKAMYFMLQPELIDRKVMADKVVFRGAGVLHYVYMGTDGKVYVCDFEMPFAQYGELTGQFSEDAQARIRLAVTNLEVTPDPNGALQVNAGLTGQYMVYETVDTQVISDAYSTKQAIETSFEQVQLPVIQEMESKTYGLNTTVQAEPAQVVDAVVFPEQPELMRTDDGMCLELAGTVQLLYYTKDGELDVATGNWNETGLCQPMDCRMEPTIALTGKVQTSLGGGQVNVGADVLLDVVRHAAQGLCTVCGLELSERNAGDEDRPSLILRRAGQESLWDMAKATGSTVVAIKAANGLTEEPEPNRMLIIPVS